MNMNLSMIYEELTLAGIPVSETRKHLCSKPWEARLEFSWICEEFPADLKENILYICPAHLLSRIPNKKMRYSFLCTGVPEISPNTGNSEYLCVKSRFSLSDLCNEISKIFFHYKQWEDALQLCVEQKGSLHELGRITASMKITQNPLSGAGADYKMLFLCMPETSDRTPKLEEYYKNYYLPDNTRYPQEDINTMIADQEYLHAISATEPTIYSGSPYGFRSLFYNIRINNVLTARVLLDEIAVPLRKTDFLIIKTFAKYIQQILTRFPVRSFGQSVDMDQILGNLLAHHLIPEEIIISLLESLHWKMDDTFFILVLEMNAQNVFTETLDSTAINLSGIFGNDCYMVYENHIVFVVNDIKLKSSKKNSIQAMLPILRDNLLMAGISNLFHDFKSLYYFYQQAVFSLEAGKKKHPTQWYFYFEDYQLDYFFRHAKKGTIPEAYIPEGLSNLMRYDKRKGTSYAQLLNIYLEHDRNIADTIRIAYLHRNTFLYRLQRIKEILQMDLNDPQVRLLLRMTFQLLKGEGYSGN